MGMCADGNCPECVEAKKSRLKLAELRLNETQTKRQRETPRRKTSLSEVNRGIVEEFLSKQK